MTVKQFGYVAIGAVGAVIIYYLPLLILLKIILIPLFIIGGVALAFLPIEGRPIDIMLINFFKALFSPNQFIYQKAGGHLLLSTVHLNTKAAAQAANQTGGSEKTSKTAGQRDLQRQQQLSAYLSSLHKTSQAMDDKESQKLALLFGQPAIQPTSQPSAQPLQQQITTPPERKEATEQVSAASQPDTVTRITEDTKKLVEENALIQQVNEELAQARNEEQQTQAGSSQIAHTKVMELEQKMKEIMLAKQELEAELSALQAPVASPAPSPKIQKTIDAPVVAPAPTPTPKNAMPAAQPTADFPSLPDSPNILLGVVKDSSGNVLPRILVEVTDTEGSPIRAFKTNQLGQFMSATPIKDGEYTISCEDPKNQYKFDPVKLSVRGEILPPIEIAAHDLREELRKALFA